MEYGVLVPGTYSIMVLHLPVILDQCQFMALWSQLDFEILVL
jgi:hypothetical protein